MKISKLLVLSALWLVGLSASAADLIERQAPVEPSWAPKFGEAALTLDDITKTPVEFKVGKLYVIYNTGKELFFSQGCAWSTQAAVDETPIVVRFTLPEGKTLADNALLLNDYNLYTNSWKQAFFDSATGIFTDRASQGNFYWNVIAGANNTYRLQASAVNETFNPSAYEGFVGYDEATPQGGDTHGRGIGDLAWALSPFLTEGEGHHIDWHFYEVPGLSEWQDYYDGLDVYDKAMELKALIETAEEAGIDVSEAVAVYNNGDATVGDFVTAIAALKDKMANSYDKILEPATVDQPIKASFYITNATFDNASNANWEGTVPNMVGSGSHGPADLAEHYNKTYDTYQNLGAIRPGIYQLKNQAFYRGSYDDYKNHTNYISYLYASVGEDTLTVEVANPWEAQNTESMAGATEFGTTAGESSQSSNDQTYFIPNDPSAARLYFEKGFYNNQLFFEVKEGETPSIGMLKKTTISGDWTCFDNFELVYYGAPVKEAFVLWLKNSEKNFDDVICTSSYLEAYKACFAADVTDKAGVLAAIESAKEPEAALLKNITLWTQYKAIIEEANAVVIQIGDNAVVGELADYISFDAENILEELTLTNEELETEIQKVRDMITNTNNAIKTDTDITARFLKNANFSSGKESWTVGSDSRPGLDFRESIAEAYDTNFDLYQEVTNMPKGVYEVQLQGFFRMARDNDAYNMYTSGQQKTDAGVYINNNKTSLKCVFEQPLADTDERAANKKGGWWQNTNVDNAFYPNDMTSAANAFSFETVEGEAWYLNKAFGLVVEDGETLKIGVGGDVRGANWICFDNFRLIYRGYSADVVGPVLEEALNNLPSLDEMMTKTTYEKYLKAVEDAQNALNSNDGRDMFEALVAIYALSEEVRASVALCKSLNDEIDALSEEVSNAINVAAMNDAYALIQDLQEKLSNKEVEDSQIEGYKIDLKKMRTKLMLDPDYVNATAENPVEITKVIKTPSFETSDGMNSIAGWEADGYNFGNDDTQKGALLLEFFNKTFDLYQEIYGLPAGYYLLSADAFSRLGGIAEDFKAYAENPDSAEAYIYGQSGDLIDSLNVWSLAKGAITEDMSIDGQGIYEDTAAGITYYIPNDMVSAFAFFQNGAYKREVAVRVAEGEPLRIGIRKTKNTADGWAIMDNFQLSYLGTNAEGKYIETGINANQLQNAETVRVEFYTIDGRNVKTAQKGINIQKVIKADGSVVVKKVRK